MAALLHLEIGFPKLASAGYEKTSEATGGPLAPGSYNCIAWAAEDTHHGFWWPDQYGYWPFWIKREVTIPCFVKTFRSLGYRICGHSRRQVLFHKVVLYAIHRSRNPMPVPTSLAGFTEWEPTHMARQLPDGSWTSKCGGKEDIAHFTLDALESYGPRHGALDEYGCPVIYMRRFVVITAVVRLGQFLQRIYELISDNN